MKEQVKQVAMLVAVAGAISLVGDADAAGRGPRSSISVDSVCSLKKENGTFNVELRVRDRSSAQMGATVTGYEVKALAKVTTGNWNYQQLIATAGQTGLNKAVPPAGMITIPASFTLCSGKDINPVVAGAKGLNAMVTTTYADGTVANMCSDDPNTVDIVEPGGIKLTANDINDIANYCKAALP